MLHVVVQLSMKGSEGGRGVRLREACGACVQNTCMQKQERESAIMLGVPGRCCTEIFSYKIEAMEERHENQQLC